MIAPANGATQNIHSWLSASPPAISATAVLLAGFTDVFVTGILIKWIKVNPNPIAIGANPFGAFSDVDPNIINKNIAVNTTSVNTPEANEYPFGERAPTPFNANPLSKIKVEEPEAIASNTNPPINPPTTWANIYGITSFLSNFPAVNNPIVTAGFKWHPDICPIANAIVKTVNPKAKATPVNPIPSSGYPAAKTALPHPPN